MTNPEYIENNNKTLANCLRIHRRRTGLSQEELGRLLGYHDESAVAKHERFKTMPPFLIALGYEVIFGVPVSALFPGVAQTIALGIDARLAEFERQLRNSGGGEMPARLLSRKLDWLNERQALILCNPRNA
jgi:transcriptional regulator with XRE-family HTH domain